MATYFTSDCHFGHANIIKHSQRPFGDVEEMDNVLVHNWNARVTPRDTVWFLGDFCWKDAARYRRRLNGSIHLIKGNHDKCAVGQPNLWASVQDVALISVEGNKFFLSHYAHRVWPSSHRATLHLYGHSHGNLADDPNALSLDVGVDCWNYFPVSLDQIRSAMEKKTFRPIDHHGVQTATDK